MPTGADIYEHYLKPLAATPRWRVSSRPARAWSSVTRPGMDKVTSRGRDERPFVLSIDTGDGRADAISRGR